jgi:hypothetical protein
MFWNPPDALTALNALFTNLYSLFNYSNIRTQIIYRNPVRTSHETHHVSVTKPNRLMLFRETAAVYCEIHTEHTDTLCGRIQFCYAKASGIYSNHWVLNM